MGAEVSFNFDANQVVSDIFSSPERNDLAVVIENGLTMSLTVRNKVYNGNASKTYGQSVIAAMPALTPGQTSETPNAYGIGVSADGNGSGVFIYITSGQNVWGLYARTPPNASNYFQYTYYGWPKAFTDTYNATVASTKFPANSGPQYFSDSTGSTYQDTYIVCTMSNTSPSDLQIQFYPSAT